MKLALYTMIAPPLVRRFMLACFAIGTIATPVRAGDGAWLPAASRFKATYEAGAIGNRGLQFQRVIAWNQGVADPAKRGWIVTGQDENSVRVSYDYGATWTSPRLAGLFCARMGGLYLNTDDNLFVALGGHFASPDFVGVHDLDGIYVGDGSLRWARRVEITRPSGPGPAAPGGGVRAFTQVNYTGNSFDRDGNFLARRPQVKPGAPLSDAQRPVWALEQVIEHRTLAYIALFKSTDAGASFHFVRELPVSEFATGHAGLYRVLAAPNGDIAVLGKRGLWLSVDQGVTFAKKYPERGDQEVSSGYFYGGGVNSPSGLRIGVYEADAHGGVWDTPDIRQTGFIKPNGNAGLPPNYRVWQMDGSPVNPDRLAVCTDDHPPYLSTDGGRHFTRITEIKGVGDIQWRYDIRGKLAGGHAGFHFCPTDEMQCLIPTAQTMARSIDGAASSDGNLVAGFDGMHTKGYAFAAPDGDWKTILRVCQDSLVNFATDGMNWVTPVGLSTGSPVFKQALARAGAGQANYVSGASGVIGSDRRLIVGANRNVALQSNVMVIVDLQPDGAYDAYLIKNPRVTSRCTFSFRSPQDVGLAFVGRWAVSNLQAQKAGDIVFTDHDGHEIFGCLLDGATLVTYWSNVHSGANQARNGNKIYRATNADGTNHQDAAWYTLPVSSFTERAVCADHFNPERVLYVRNDHRDEIREISRVNGRLRDEVLRDARGRPVNLRTMPGGILDTLRAESGGAVKVPAGATAIIQLISDPNQPGIFYAIAGLHGMPNWWRTVDNGRTWTNISGDAPRTLWTGVVNPHTGELMGFSSMGEHIHPSPAVYPALPHRDALSQQIRRYFDLHCPNFPGINPAAAQPPATASQ